jgi:hypothetical protein
VVVIRERNGCTVPAVFKSEAAATAFIKSRVARGTVIHADEASSWNELHASFDVRRINHEPAYSFDGACTNGAEGFFSRMRRSEAGHHHHISGAYLIRCAQEAAFREDRRRRRQDNGEQFARVVELVAINGPSMDFCGYWQRGRTAA